MGANVAADWQNKDMSEEAFQKKHGRSKGSYTALAESYFGKYGGFTPGAVKDFNNMKETLHGTDAMAARAGEFAGKGNEALQELRADFRRQKMTSLYDELGAGGAIKMQKLFDGAGGEAALAELYGSDSEDVKKVKLAGILGTSEGIDKVVSTITKDPTQRAKAARAAAAVDVSAYQSSEAAKAATGGIGGASKGVGDVSGETLKALEAQSAQLVANYNQLITMANTLKEITDGIRKR